MKTKHSDWLESHEACDSALDWIQENNVQSLQEAWNACERGDWMLWLAAQLGVDKRKLTLCAALCAHTVVQYMDDPSSRNAVRVAFLWSRGKATDEQLEEARKDAWAAAWDADAEAADWSAERAAERAAARAAYYAAADWSDADAACAADWSAVVAAWAERAAYWAARAAWVSAPADEKENRRQTAEIARKQLTDEVRNAIRQIDFVCHGTYTISNAWGYEIEISNDGEAARIRDNGKVTDWLSIRFCYGEEDETVAIIDPEGYNINLDCVLTI